MDAKKSTAEFNEIADGVEFEVIPAEELPDFPLLMQTEYGD